MVVRHPTRELRLVGAYFALNALVLVLFGIGFIGTESTPYAAFVVLVGVCLFPIALGIWTAKEWALTAGIVASFLALVANLLTFSLPAVVPALLCLAYLIKTKGPSNSSWAPGGARDP
ncbi:hypothetical protein [Haloarchaeobius amylolyticus]|uniref:hypothetical protein n=1 Tax=Haloarchaeobius amylolyticus TaxID=1198296 RepID=UPI002270F37E|nr:hypothetical protein [Haloarchaeobius amylolyticus]